MIQPNNHPPTKPWNATAGTCQCCQQKSMIRTCFFCEKELCGGYNRRCAPQCTVDHGGLRLKGMGNDYAFPVIMFWMCRPCQESEAWNELKNMAPIDVANQYPEHITWYKKD